ncbi:hypothetical protein BDR26DRAFT_898068 [Obelidium mucronatum]|nr:hypothetical protein BDR26DRAFT_898068 [Obelidium mucronatum]
MRFTTQQVCVSEIALSNDEVGDLILRILCAHIEAVVVFDPSQPASIDKLSSVIHAGRPIYETRRHRPTAFIRFMLTRVIHPMQFRRFVSDEAKLSALKILAETVEYGVDLEKIIHPFLAGLTFLFKEHRVTERDYSLETNIFPKLECLLYVLYEVQMQNWMQFKPKPETLTHPDLAEYLKQMYINTEKLTGTFAPNNSDGKRSSLYNCFKLVRELLKPFDRRIVRAKFLKEKVMPFSWVVRSVPERGVDAFDGTGARRPVQVSIPQSEIIQSKPSKLHQAIAASQPEVEVIVIDDDDDGPIMETTTGTTTGRRKLSGNQVSKPQPIVWDERKFAVPPKKKGAKRPLNPQQPEVLEQQPEVDIIPEEQMYPQQYQNPPPLQIRNNNQRRKLNLNKRTAAAVAGQVSPVASNIPVRKSIAESCHRKIETKDQGVQTASPLSYDSATMTDLDSEEASRQTGIRVLTPTHLRPAYVEAPEEIRANTLFLPEPAALDNSTVAVYNGSILYREKTKSPAPAATVPRIFPVEHHFQDQSSSLLPSQSIFSQTPNIPHSISIVHAAIERRKSVDQPLPQQFIPPEDFIPVHGDVVFMVADNGRRSDVDGVVEKNGFNRKLQRDKAYYDRKPYSRGYKGPSKEIHIAGVSQQSDGGGSAGGRFVEDRPRSIRRPSTGIPVSASATAGPPRLNAKIKVKAGIKILE